MMTRIAGAASGGSCPRWRAFLEEITGGDPEMQAYLQRIAGYCLTGLIAEQVFFFFHGPGANGKSIFVNTLAAALGGYATTAPFETFAASVHPGHPTELAGLVGARLVVVSETEQGRAWSETRIKAVTGGDVISARFMRGDFFEYRPTFKLMIAGNHLPRLTSFGEAMRRRLHLVPFRVTIPESKRDPRLQQQLLAELGGVLSWMIEGCADWRASGLAPPASVRAAGAEYFEDEDVVGQWIAERCESGDGLFATSTALFKDWSAYAESAGHIAGSQRALGAELAARGFRQVRSSRARGWSGLALRRRGGPT
jgi:putative DNA primase/helicase